MSDVFHEDHCSRWPGIPQQKQTEFTRRAVGLLVTAFRTGVYNLPIKWDRVDWRYGNGVSFVLGRRPSLASWDFNQLTRLVIGAHDECIRVEVEPHGFGYLRISMWPRKGRDGNMADRHPTIEQAVASYREDNPSPQPQVMEWQPIATAPTDGTIVNVVGRYPGATAGFPRYAGFARGMWLEYSRFEPQPLICWAWRPRGDWPEENTMRPSPREREVEHMGSVQVERLDDE